MEIRVGADWVVVWPRRLWGIGTTRTEGVPFPGDSDRVPAVAGLPLPKTKETEGAPESCPERQDFFPVSEHFIAELDPEWGLHGSCYRCPCVCPSGVNSMSRRSRGKEAGSMAMVRRRVSIASG